MRFAIPFLKAIFLVLAAILPAREVFAAGEITLYVRANGSDVWSGRLAEPAAGRNDGPVATLAGARNALRRMRLQGKAFSGPVKVLFGDGIYPIAQTVVFGPADSGTADCPITYAAMEGAKPVLSGASPISGWRKDPTEKYWTAALPQGKRGIWNFRELFVNGRRAIRARYPNKEDYWFFIERMEEPARDGVAIYRDPKHLSNWPDLGQIEIVLFRVWDFSRERIKSVDEKNLRVRLDVKPDHPVDRWKADRRYYLENSLRFLDEPGEWFLDRKRGVVYLRPFDDATFADAVVTAPAVDRLIRFEGREQKNVEHLRFEGLTFACSDWSIPPDGYCGRQGDVEMGAAIEGDFVSSLEFRKCLFTGLGRYGLWLRQGCRNNRVTECEFSDLGGGAIQIGECARGGIPKYETSGNEFTYNHVHDCGQVWLGACGIWVGLGNHTLIGHNHVHNHPYTGISVGWVWDDDPSGAHHNIVEFNHVHDVMQLMGDGGGIYTLGRQNGTVIRNNVVHDVWAWHSEGSGIYTDQGSSGLVIENNLVARIINNGIGNGTNDNITRNNIVAFTGASGLGAWEGNRRTWQNNIVYIDEGLLVGAGLNGRQNRFEQNLYYHVFDPLAQFPDGYTLDQWRKTGQDNGSLFADPLFVDPQGGDFRLKPESPAFKIGFKPFDVPNIGPEMANPRKSPRLCEMFRIRPVKVSLNKSGEKAQLLVHPRTREITIDGKVGAREWDGVEQVQLQQNSYGGKSPYNSYMSLAYDEKYFYVLVVNTVDNANSLRKTTSQWPNDDGAEVCLRNLSSATSRPLIVIRGFVSGAHETLREGQSASAEAKALDQAVQFAATVGAAHWRGEWKIPFAPCGIDPAKDKRIAFNVGVRKAFEHQWILWIGTGGPTSQLENAGEIVLSPTPSKSLSE